VASKRSIVAVSIVLATLGCSSERAIETTLILDVATSPKSCGDGNDLVATAMGSGRAKLNSETFASLDQLAARIHEAQRYRVEKLLYVTAEDGVDWGDFVAMVKRAGPEADVVSVLTPEVVRLARQSYCLAPSCGRCEGFRSTKLKSVSRSALKNSGV